MGSDSDLPCMKAAAEAPTLPRPRRRALASSELWAASLHTRGCGRPSLHTRGRGRRLFTRVARPQVLEQFGVPYEITIVSAHRTPARMYEFAREADGRGVRVIIAGAGGAAHLPGMVAALTPLLTDHQCDHHVHGGPVVACQNLVIYGVVWHCVFQQLVFYRACWPQAF